jgi:hypothetical protein
MRTSSAPDLHGIHDHARRHRSSDPLPGSGWSSEAEGVTRPSSVPRWRRALCGVDGVRCTKYVFCKSRLPARLATRLLAARHDSVPWTRITFARFNCSTLQPFNCPVRLFNRSTVQLSGSIFQLCNCSTLLFDCSTSYPGSAGWFDCSTLQLFNRLIFRLRDKTADGT